jgi:hypothetical protein
MLVSRISRRVLVEHHIALSNLPFGRPHDSDSPEEPHVGIIFTGLNVKRSIQTCARLLREKPVWVDHRGNDNERREWPNVVIDGHLETRFSYIREHLEFVVFSCTFHLLTENLTDTLFSNC